MAGNSSLALGSPWHLEELPELVERVMPAVVTVEVRSGLRSGNGSGFVVPAHDNDSRSVVVTNAHVVLDASEVVVVFADERCCNAEIACVEAGSDLAILSVDYVPLAEVEPRPLNDVRIGESVIAIGAPYALSGSVSTGIVSGLNRSRPTPNGGLVDMIQTDAAINDGNSGGPLIGLDGRVIGINSQGFVGYRGEVLPGLKFAVPVELAVSAYEEVLETGANRLRRGTLGIRARSHRFDHATRSDLKQPSGALIVDEPDNGTPAAKADLHRGDVIIALDGSIVDDPGDLYRLLNRTRIEKTCQLGYLRDGEQRQASIVPVERDYDKEA